MEEVFLLKTAALLHDPPDKAWCLAKKRSHEGRAKELAGKMLNNTPLEEAVKLLNDKRVKNADKLAASVDRILLGKLVGDKYEAFYTGKIKLKNPLNPAYEVELDEHIDEEGIEKAVEEINSMLKQTKDIKEAYFAFYGLYELIWIKKGLPSGPADTRIPTHTVFDHLYAAASAVNWTYGERGSLLYLDTAGVQDFISFSRKLRDLWASSYMISAFLWSLALDFLEEYGPDVILIPTCRFNPFFIHYLAGKIPKIRNYVLEAAEAIGYNIKEEYEQEGGWIYPRFATVPGSMTLILPSLNAEELIEESLRSKWRKFYEEIKRLKEKNESLAFLIGKLEDAEGKGYGFSDVPPFEVRASSAIRDLKEPFYDTYMSAFEEIREKNELKRLLKRDPASALPLTEITEKIFSGKITLESERGFEYCSMCGRLPSIVSGAKEPYVGDGEKLCPYCLIKRIFSFEPSGALRAILGYEGSISMEFPSLADIAAFDFRNDILKKSMEINKKYEEDVIFRALLEKASDTLKKGAKKPPSMWRYRRRKFADLENMNINSDLKNILSGLLLEDAEDLILRIEKEEKEKKKEGPEESPRDYWRRVRRELEKNKISISPLNTYYSLIKADGDDITKIMEGRIGGRALDIKSYIENSFEGKSREVIKSILSKDIESARRIVREEGIDERNLEELQLYISEEILKKEKVPETISYHTSVSRALIITALKDVKLIEDRYDGVVIYAGGDDLLAITAVKNAMGAVGESRREYLGERGFHKFKNYYMPSMGNCGRSYSVYIAHYKYPLYSVIRDSNDKIDSIAKDERFLWIDGGKTRRKDSLVITYSPRGSPTSSVIPLSLSGGGKDFALTDMPNLITDIMKKIYEEEKISASLLYNLLEEDFLSSLERAFNLSPEIYKKLIEYAIGRHTTDERTKEELMKQLEGYIMLRREKIHGGERKLLPVELFRSCKLLLSGLRGD